MKRRKQLSQTSDETKAMNAPEGDQGGDSAAAADTSSTQQSTTGHRDRRNEGKDSAVKSSPKKDDETSAKDLEDWLVTWSERFKRPFYFNTVTKIGTNSFPS